MSHIRRRVDRLIATRTSFGVVRALVALAGIVALIGDFDYVLGFRSFTTSNYFSYFTNQSNMAGVLVLLAGAWFAFRAQTDPDWLVTTRMLTTTYVIVSGIVFGLIVSQAGDHNYRIVVPWSSQLLHFWIPSYAILDWLIAPGRRRIRWRSLWLVLVYPLAWGAFTMVRGAIVGWYPYFFLDPGQVSGPAEFAAYSGAVLALILGLAAALAWATRFRSVAELFLAGQGERAPRSAGGRAAS